MGANETNQERALDRILGAFGVCRDVTKDVSGVCVCVVHERAVHQHRRLSLERTRRHRGSNTYSHARGMMPLSCGREMSGPNMVNDLPAPVLEMGFDECVMARSSERASERT